MAHVSSILVCLLLYSIYGFVFTSSVVKCPNPASNCLTEIYNGVVIPHIGCIGCQDGCKAGFMQTMNNKYNNNSGDATGFYKYQNIEIRNTVNIYEPEWTCVVGDTCRPGYFLGKTNTKYCAWCGDGCRKCTSFKNCHGCLGGYRISSTTSLSGNITTSCVHSNVTCPTQPSNCEYNVYVSKGSGCIGCLLCKPGYTVAFNPKYIQKNTNLTSHYYDYQGLSIRTGVDINQPRYICSLGTTCADGFYSRLVDSMIICEWCGESCTSCTARNDCKACAAGTTISTDGSCQPSLIG